jgi:hypothetical protein
MTSRDLCDDCFREHRAATGDQFPILDGTQRCYYCGGPARAGGTNLESEQRARGHPFHFTCFRCSQVYHELLSASLPKLPKGLTPQAQVEALADLIADIDRQVVERVGGPEA